MQWGEFSKANEIIKSMRKASLVAVWQIGGQGVEPKLGEEATSPGIYGEDLN